jgi:DNA-binding YbaB/EbfC family protein
MINPLKIPEMLAQANQMQEEMQHKLAQTVVEGSAGGGAVTAKKQLLKIRIEPSAALSLTSGAPDVEMLEDLVVSAVNDAGRKADEAIQSSVQGMLGSLKLPGLS